MDPVTEEEAEDDFVEAVDDEICPQPGIPEPSTRVQQQPTQNRTRKPVLTTGICFNDDLETSSDDEIIYETMKRETESIQLRVVGGSPGSASSLASTPLSPKGKARATTSSEDEFREDYFDNHASPFENDLDSLQINNNVAGPTNPRKSAFVFAGSVAEYAGKKSREYRVKQIARTVGKTATLAADIGLSYFGYTRVGADGEPVMKAPGKANVEAGVDLGASVLFPVKNLMVANAG
ncbi:hypothetical protein HDU98_011105 [Podochytrium sp. JEL0797]|nr:hypothetical protein HDU98_011105 [Podochytrium sp. JEL0797]